jgi:hypothetical protein
MLKKKGKQKGQAATTSAGSVADINDDLWFACRENNVARVQAITAGADVNYARCDYTNASWSRPLEVAIKSPSYYWLLAPTRKS